MPFLSLGEAMRRPDQTGGKAAKTQRRKALKRRGAPKAARHAPVAGKETNVARLTRERDEALEQLAATSEVLNVISGSSVELEPVFSALLANAVRLCEAKFGTLYLCDEGGIILVALIPRLAPLLAKLIGPNNPLALPTSQRRDLITNAILR